MLIQLLALTNFALAAWDASITFRRIRAFGVNIELNRSIRKLSTHMGPELATILSIGIPAVAQSLLCTWFGLIVPLAMVVGFRLRFFYTQALSLKYESQIKDFLKK